MCTAYRASFRHILEKKVTVLFILSLQQQMLLTSAFSKQNSAISLEEWVLVLKLFTTATRKLRVKGSELTLVGPVSVHCVWVIAPSVYVWQHIMLCEKTRSSDTLDLMLGH